MGAREIVQGASQPMRETESGLVVPSHVLNEKKDAERKRVRWTRDTFKRVRRFVEEMQKQQPAILPLLTCVECKQLIAIVRLDGDQIANADVRKMSDQIALRCTCTDRTFVQGV
jgi:hypothetical protein